MLIVIKRKERFKVNIIMSAIGCVCVCGCVCVHVCVCALLLCGITALCKQYRQAKMDFVSDSIL